MRQELKSETQCGSWMREWGSRGRFIYDERIDSCYTMNIYLGHLKAQCNTPLPPSSSAAYDFEAWVNTEYTYESNAIEGNTLMRSETGILLGKGFSRGNRKRSTIRMRWI